MSVKVAILQHNIIKGGRLAVIARIVKNLNMMDIVPDIITGQINFKLSSISHWYGYSISANVINLHISHKHFPEYQILQFNKEVNKYLVEYDWVINSTNTSQFISHYNLLEYVHFPRYYRILKNESSQNKKGLKKLVRQLENTIIKKLYQSAPYPECDVYANSAYTAEKFKNLYTHFNEVQILYPPIALPDRPPEITKNNDIVSVGRFHPSKAQLKIIQLAEKMPDFNFTILGFSSPKNPYLKICRDYIARNKVSNVSLIPNSDITQRDTVLRNASYFLHLLENEPFGISTVQGISQGCVPIVPNNGGQVEIVNNDLLRFDNQDQIPSKIRAIHKISHKNFQDLYHSLFDHIQAFSEEEFDRKFQKIIKNHV